MILVRCNGMEEYIDEGIAPLIEELWKADIFTVLSCEENRPGWIWIDFYSVGGVEKFLSIVTHFEQRVDCLYNRIRGDWCPKGSEIVGQWEFDISIDDLAVEETIEDGCVKKSCSKPSDFHFFMSVRFPKSDYPTLLERVKQYNDSGRAAADRANEWKYWEEQAKMIIDGAIAEHRSLPTDGLMPHA